MDDVDMDEPSILHHDLCNSILSHFTHQNHQHLFSTLQTISRHMNHKNQPPSPLSYFCATLSSLDLTASKQNPSHHDVLSLLTILSLVIPGVPLPVLENQKKFLSDLLARLLHSPSVSKSVFNSETLLYFVIPRSFHADQDFSRVHIWLLEILKKYVVGARLSYFTNEILTIIELLRNKSRKLEKWGLIVSSRKADELANSLWSLLPSFCNYPLDTAESFMVLKEHFCIKLREEPGVRQIICKSLQLLIQQNKDIVDANYNDSMEQVMVNEQGLVRYSHQVATDNLNVLKSSAKSLLDALFEVFLKSTKDDGDHMQRTICDIASIADKAVVSRLFTSRLNELYKLTNEASNTDRSKSSSSMQIDGALNNMSTLPFMRAQYLDFAASLLPGLNAKEINTLLLLAIKPALQDVEGVVQKKAYKGLLTILRSSNSFVSSKFEELFDLMVETCPSYHISAKRHRFDCLYFLTGHVSKSKDNVEDRLQKIVDSSLLTEIVLAMKEDNKKTRNKASDILLQIGQAFEDEERGWNKENLCHFFNMVAGGLAGGTPLMIGATAKCLSHLVYNFSDLVSSAFNWLSIFLLLRIEDKEIIKANLGYLKVLVAKSQAEGLKVHLRSMVEGLLKWHDNTKNHFKAEVELLLAMLVIKCGLEAVKEVMPEEHMKLLSYIRKIKERRERKPGAKSEETKSHLSKATTSRQSMWNLSKLFSDCDEDSDSRDAEHPSGKTFSRRGKSSLHLKSAASSLRAKNVELKQSLPEHLSDQSDDEPLDLLDQQKTWSALKSSDNHKRKSRLDEDDDEVELDSEGRLIIREEGQRMKEKRAKPDFDTRSESESHLSAKSGTKASKRRKTVESGGAYTGKEYCSKRAGGDVKRKDKLEPYAYWPLDRKMLSRRPQQRATARKGMASVVKMTRNLEGMSASSSVLSLKSLKLKKTQKKGWKGKKRSVSRV